MSFLLSSEKHKNTNLFFCFTKGVYITCLIILIFNPSCLFPLMNTPHDHSSFIMKDDAATFSPTNFIIELGCITNLDESASFLK